MSTLYAVRHGQASFGQANYDKLSELGEEQCRLLGEYWVRQGIVPDAVYTGTLERQRASASIVGESFQAAGLEFPEIVEMPELNEYDTAGILTGSIPDLIAKNPEIMALAKKLSPDGRPDLINNKKDFQAMFARIMDIWVEGGLKVPGMESWSDFTARVRNGLGSIISENGSGRSVAVFTSGGTISAIMQKALKTPDRISLDLGWGIMNSSVSEFKFSGDRFSLMTFNTAHHLSDAGLITFR